MFFHLIAGQFLALVLSLATQTDLVMSIITFMMLWTERRVYWTKLIKAPEDSSLWIWVSRIAFPIACEFLEGFFVLVATFVIVIQSNNIIDLFKDFAAMQLISEFDNMVSSNNCNKEITNFTSFLEHYSFILDVLACAPWVHGYKTCWSSQTGKKDQDT